MTSVHKPNWSIAPKCETNPEFMRLKKLCLVALKGEIIIWQTHSISFPGCWHANEAHLYNLSKWKTDNQIPSEAINIQLGVAYAKSCSWRNSKGWRVDHSGKRRQIGIQNISQLRVSRQVTGFHAFTVYHRISNAPSSLFQWIDVSLPNTLYTSILYLFSFIFVEWIAWTSATNHRIYSLS